MHRSAVVVDSRACRTAIRIDSIAADAAFSSRQEGKNKNDSRCRLGYFPGGLERDRYPLAARSVKKKKKRANEGCNELPNRIHCHSNILTA